MKTRRECSVCAWTLDEAPLHEKTYLVPLESTADYQHTRSRSVQVEVPVVRRKGWRGSKRVMKLSADRILTTHTGSLPRPPDLVALLNSKELGESYDRAAFSGRVRRAILEIVRHQADAGIDIVDDGEHSKVNWMAYARVRLSGLEEIDSPVSFRGPTRDSLAFPRAYEDMKVMLAARSAHIVPKRMVRPRAQVCSGAIAYVGQDELAEIGRAHV